MKKLGCLAILAVTVMVMLSVSPVSALTGEVDAVKSVLQVAGGSSHSVALCSDGSVWSWGHNANGQMGNGTTNYGVTLGGDPVQASGLSEITQIAAGNSHSLALKADGSVWAWGSNSYGQLGDGTMTQRNTPVQVSGLGEVTQIAAGNNHSLALKADGSVWGWGYNAYGQLGDGTTVNRNTPVAVSDLGEITQIAAGHLHSLALKADGSVWGWGHNYYGQLGDGTSIDRNTPVQASGLSGVTQIAAGYLHSLAVKTDGTLWAWGYNVSGQLGDGTTTQRDTPVQINSLSGITQIAAGMQHSLAAKEDGTLWAFGSNDYGQLGDGTAAQSHTPVQTNGLSGIRQIGSGHYHSLALQANGSVWAWGDNFYGQAGHDSLNAQALPRQIFADHFGEETDDEETFTLTIVGGAGGTVNSEASGSYTADTIIDLMAEPDEDYVFVAWETSHGGMFGEARLAETAFLMPAQNTTVTATFESIYLDSDGDGLPDYLERLIGTDPYNADTDGDGLPDGYEIYFTHTDPLLVDTDGNGISDADEDLDGDGLTNLQEYLLGTRPDIADTDGDGLSDGDEVNIYGTDPLNPDTDGDGLLDGEEIKLGLDPKNPKTDGVTPDGERRFNQVAEDTAIDDALLDSENWLVPSIAGNVPGDISRRVFLEKDTSYIFDDNPTVLSDVINAYTSYELPLTLSFDYDQAYTGDVRNLVIASYGEDGFEMINTALDEGGKIISGEITGNGMYFVIDLDEFLKRVGIDVFANLEPIAPQAATFSAFDTGITATQSASTAAIPSPLDAIIAQNSPELYSLIDMAEKTQAGEGYGPNGKFLAPIEAPVAGSIPISTRAELEAIENNLSGKYHLVNDIDLGRAEWVPIDFYGTFDGQGHVIKNLTITGDIQDAGLFGHVSDNWGGTTIKNVGLEDLHIDISPESSAYAGGICGSSAGSLSGGDSISIHNCYNIGDISASYAGGICGYSSNSVLISSCYNAGDISSNSPDWYAYAGGICGYFWDANSISNCYNIGGISSNSSNSRDYAGGICGYATGDSDADISNCYNAGDISSTLYYAGGICGRGYVLISSCYNAGDISAYGAGGIYGYGLNSINNCYNAGDISSTLSNSEAGGICSYALSIDISNCYNAGDISASYAGGICGYSSNSSFGTSATISFSCNTGNIFATSYAGGICGAAFNGPSIAISDCYNTGSVSSSTYEAGGIFGTTIVANPISIANCYNTGNVSARIVGGIHGSYSSTRACVVLSSTITSLNNFRAYLIGSGATNTNNLALSGISGNAENDATRLITPSEARSQSTYAALGWDFENVWEMVPGYDYPQLRGLAAADIDDELVILKDYTIVQLSDKLANAAFNDTDKDGLSDAVELGTSKMVDLTPYIMMLLGRHAIIAAESSTTAGSEATSYAATSYAAPVYTGKTGILVWNNTSNPVLPDTDFDGIPDGFLDYGRIVTPDLYPNNNKFTGRMVGDKVGSNYGKVEFTVDYRDFFGSNQVYNRRLSILSSLFSFDIYGDEALRRDNYRYLEITSGVDRKGDKTVGLLETFGMYDTRSYEISSPNSIDTDDKTQFAIGHRYVEYGGKKKEIIAVVFRGTNGTIEEWSSNSDVGANTAEYYARIGQQHPDWQNLDNHKGFDVAANRAIAKINEYLGEVKFQPGAEAEKVIWITGHSRGAAIANIVGAHFEDRAGFYSFTYAFATPNCTTASTALNYRTIFNIVNEDDFVTMVPQWKFKRYGRTLEESIKAEYTYAAAFSKGYLYKEMWDALMGRGYNSYSGVTDMANTVAAVATTRDDLYKYTCSCHGDGSNNKITIRVHEISTFHRDAAIKNIPLRAQKYVEITLVSATDFTVCQTPAYLMQLLASVSGAPDINNTKKKEVAVGNFVFDNIAGRYEPAKWGMIWGKVFGIEDPHLPQSYYLLATKFTASNFK